MAFKKLNLRPGINKQFTPTLNEGGWSDGNLVRFRDGLPQKWGGWVKFIATPLDSACRGCIQWAQLDQELDAAFGTDAKLWLYQGGTIYDITPLDGQMSPNPATLGSNPLSTTSGSKNVVVDTTTNHLRTIGDNVSFSGATVFNNVTIAGSYTVSAVPSSTTFTIVAGTTANATGAGGGAAVALSYFLPSGAATSYAGLGWGTAGWGVGTWGTPRTPTAAQFYARTWALDHWGQDLVANAKDRAIYTWTAASGPLTIAAAVAASDAPTFVKFVHVGLPERHLIAYGCDFGGNQDPLLVRWSDVETYNTNGDWTATATNSAGSFRLGSSGQRIMAAIPAQNITLVFTDFDVWAQQFISTPYIYSFRPLGTECGLISPNAGVEFNGTVYWMSEYGFNLYNGTVQPITCTLYNQVFGSLNRTQAEKVFCQLSAATNEVLWYYPSVSNECDAYVAYNFIEGVWYGGSAGTQLTRTAGMDREIFPQPLAVGVDNVIYQHETGVDADTAAMDSYIESGYVDIADGSEYMLADYVIPDFQNQVGNVSFTFRGLKYPNATPYSRTLSLTPTTTIVRMPVRGRGVAVRFESNVIGGNWRLEAVRVNTAPDGAR